MPDVLEQVVTYLPNSYIVTIADLVKADLLAATNLQLCLYTNTPSLSRDITLAELTEATFGGYVRKAITALNGPYMDQFGNAFITSNLQIFTSDGTGGQGVRGSFLMADNSGSAATATNAGVGGAYNVLTVITAPGSGYEVAPMVHFTGATGSGAAGYAEISGGEVVAIHVTDVGSAYTTYTIVVDPPKSLIAVGAFPFVKNMAAATDALPTVQEIVIPPIAA